VSNQLYTKGRQKFLEGALAWLSQDFKAVLVDAALYTPDLVNHEFLSDIPVGARVATSTNLASKTSTSGVADAADVSYVSLSGATVEYVAIYRDTGVAGTSPLVALIDTASGLPFTPTGTTVTVAWDNGSNKIFKL